MKHWVTYPLAGHPASAELLSKEAITRFAQTAEAAGFDGIGFTDHPAPTDRWLKAGGHDALDPLVALTFVGAVTERIIMIPTIYVLPYPHPFIVAQSIDTLWMLSEYRFTLAAGPGSLREGSRAMSVFADDRTATSTEGMGGKD